MVLPPHIGQHGAVGGLLGAGGALRGLPSHRQPGYDAPSVSILAVHHLCTTSSVFYRTINDDSVTKT